jgi:hypothetical protein
VEGDWRPEELLELLELLELELLDDFDDELDELDDLDVFDELVPDGLLELLEVLWFDVPESFAVVCAAPGRTANSAPVTATLAKDTVMVVAFSRRLPCSRSATARAISRLFMSSSLTLTPGWTVREKSENALSAAPGPGFPWPGEAGTIAQWAMTLPQPPSARHVTCCSGTARTTAPLAPTSAGRPWMSSTGRSTGST